jgi:hypothetical protein
LLFNFGTRVVIEGSKGTSKQLQLKEEQIMKSLVKKFETAMVAASFAEEGEFETARQIMNEDRKSDRPSTYDYQRPVARKELRAD